MTDSLPDLDPTSPIGKYYADALYVPRMKVWNEVMMAAISCNIYRGPTPEIVPNKPDIPPTFKPYLNPYRAWVQKTYLFLRDDGPFDHALNSLRANCAFSKWLAYPNKARHLRMGILISCAQPLLTGPLPPFMGLTAPICHLLWDSDHQVIDCVPDIITDISQFAGKPLPSDEKFTTVNVPDARELN
jgi:hypothetical protein